MRLEGSLPRRLDVQGDHRAGRDAGAGHLALRHAPVHARLLRARRRRAPGAGRDIQELGPERQPADEPGRGRSEASCDTYFYQLGYDFFKLPKERGHPLQAWAARASGSESGPASTSPARRRGLLPTPEWNWRRRGPGHWQVDRIWKPGDSIQLAIGQKDLQLTPIQLARVYAMIANGRRTCHAAPGRGRGAARRTTTGRSSFGISPVEAPEPVGVDPGALQAVRDGLLPGDARHQRDGDRGSSAASPSTVAGKTGTAEKVVTLPHITGQLWSDPVVVVWLRARSERSPGASSSARVIENGGHGGTAAAPAALRVFQQFFHVRCDLCALPGVQRLSGLEQLMVEYVTRIGDSHPRGTGTPSRGSPGRPRLAPAGRRRRAGRRRPVGNRGDHEPRRGRGRQLLPRPPGHLRGCSVGSRFLVGLFVDPGALPPPQVVGSTA